MTEIWKDIPGYSGKYQASNLGRIKSFNSNNTNKAERILKPRKKQSGRFQVVLYNNGKKDFFVHRLILLSFRGECPSGMEAMHLDDDPSNNNINNLKWGTKSENQKMKFEHNRMDQKGEKGPMAKLRNNDIIRIRDIAKNTKVERGYWTKLSRALNVTPSAISCIIHNKSWVNLI